MATITLNATEVTQFTSVEDWVNRAQRVFSGFTNRHKLVCIDTQGYCCSIGADFHESRDQNRFPVTVYLLTPSNLNYHPHP